MAFAIYGVNRVAKDFVYMFSDFDVICYIDDEYDKSEFDGKKVYRLSDMDFAHRDSLGFDQIIICDFLSGRMEKQNALMSLGLVYKRDFLYEEDFFGLLDSEDRQINPQNKPIIIWGAGKNSDFFSSRFVKFTPEFYVDSYKGGSVFYEKPVKFPDDVENIKSYFVIVAVFRDEDIVQYLHEKGLECGRDYINSEEIINTPSEMLKVTIFDENTYHLNCRTPLNHIEFLTEGELYCCCSTFMMSMGNVRDGGVTQVWNSNKHKILCLSAVNGTYSFCNNDMCPLLFGKKGEKTDKDLDAAYPVMKSSPEVSAIGFDYTCNLKCETCRTDIRVAKHSDKERMLSYADYTIREILPKTKFFIMAGDGEVFLSDAYKRIYQSAEMNDIDYIRILSNGTLFNETTWKEFKANKKGKIMLTASVDAATKASYENIRRNGNFDTLKANMAFAGELRRRGELSYFRMNFVVQKRNYKEMIDFVKWGIDIGADEVFFTKILNWGTFSPDEFNEISMMEADGITVKPELKQIIEDPIMKNKIVDLGTIQYGHDTFDDVDVENY